MRRSGPITEEMIRNGLKNGIVRIADEEGSAVCKIGDYWFYCFGEEGDYMSAEEYVNNVPEEDIVREILETLEDFRSEFPDEYWYYYCVVNER